MECFRLNVANKYINIGQSLSNVCNKQNCNAKTKMLFTDGNSFTRPTLGTFSLKIPFAETRFGEWSDPVPFAENRSPKVS